MKLLVVNADDLGYDPEIDRGILEAHQRGIVTSATAMVDSPFAAGVVRSAPRSLGIGLHAVIQAGSTEPAAEAELRRQIDLFATMRGAAPTHLDSHRHAHAVPAVLDAFAEVAAELGLPVRAMDAGMRAALRARGVIAADRFLGDASLRPAWTREALLLALSGLEDGVTELMAHPGHRPSHVRTSFGAEREVELAALCDAAARSVLASVGVLLCSYAEVRARLAGG